MNRNLMARSIAVILLGILFGYYVAYNERKTRQMGREQYLAEEGRKFDAAKLDPTPPAAMIVGAVVVTGLLAVVYEVVVIIISAVLKSKAAGAEKPTAYTSTPFS